MQDSRIAGPSSKLIPGNFSSKNEAKRFKSLSEGPAFESLQKNLALDCQKTLILYACKPFNLDFDPSDLDLFRHQYFHEKQFSSNQDILIRESSICGKVLNHLKYIF